MKIAHLTTVDLSLRVLVLPQLLAAADLGEAIGISAPGEFVPELESKGIRHIALPTSTRGMSPVSDLKAARDLWRVLREEDLDILHTHNPKPGLYGRVLGRLAGVPIVVNTVHGLYASDDSSSLKKVVVYSLEWIASRFSDAELIQSPEDFELLTNKRIMPRSKLTYLGNGVNLQRFRFDEAARKEVRQELGVSDDQIVVGLVARLVAEKGVSELIEASLRLDQRYVVVIVGPDDPEKADSIHQTLIDEGIKAGVRFLGMRSDTDRLYSGFDIFALPSHREGFPRAAMEAAASRLPVVASDIRGCRQVVDHGVNGFLFPVRDVDSLVDVIQRIGSNTELRNTMAEASVRRSVELFDEDVVVERVMATYADVAQSKGISYPG